MPSLKPFFAAAGTAFAAATAVFEHVVNALPHIATAAAAFSGFACGAYYLRQIWISRKKENK